jgi:hypothetical protein
MAAAGHELYLTNDQGVRLGDRDGRNPLATFLWLRASRVVNGVGWIDVGVPLSFDTALWCKRDFMIQIWRQPKGGALSLWRPYFIRKWRFETFDGVDSITVSGPDINDLLRRRYVVAYAGSAESDKSDYADDIMKEIVTESMDDTVAPTPDAGSREWDLLSVAGDLGDGASISKGLAFKGPLLTPSGGGVLPEIARASRVAGTDLFFDIVTSSVSASSIALEFRTYTGQRGQDLSDRIVFDEARGNMGNAFYEYDASQEITYVYGAGQGEGEARNVQQVYDSDRYGASVWNRCEGVADARNETTDNAVREKARDLLRDGEPVEIAGGVLKDTRETKYGQDWGFGDKIKARYKGHEFLSVVNSVVLSVNKAGEQVVARWDYISNV